MPKIAFFDTKPYDRHWFDRANNGRLDITYFETKLVARSSRLGTGFDAVCVFVNDDLDADVVNALADVGVKMIALRCAGFSNVDLKTAKKRGIPVVRVPAYSPYAVAEHAMALLLAVNRRIPRSYIRTRDFNFSLVGLCGTDLHGKCAGVIGTGKIGQAFVNILRGFGMKIVAYDPYPVDLDGVENVTLDELFARADVISLHCPLTPDTKHILNDRAFGMMKDGVFIINTSRGALIDSQALLDALNSGKVRGAGLDVYEEEADLFFEDWSDRIVLDETLSLLVSRPNVIITSHQAFLTEEALAAIADTTLSNILGFFENGEIRNEVKAPDKSVEFMMNA